MIIRQRQLRKQKGAALIEFGLIVALVALVCVAGVIAGVTAIGTNASALFNDIPGRL